ncbi:MAG: NifB/NifX family molybdenum-iron cluster-binding protein, partial [Bacillota bacterium]|nr:NifB/NifX family molybdenum-iron cluster-binding protein [Bacillota bacterium]
VLLDGNGVDVLICGGLGGCARQALGEAGIKILPGVRGDVDAAVKAYLDGTLDHDPNYTCNHHGHEHGEGHQCGHHHEHGEGHQCAHHHGGQVGRYNFVFGKKDE